MKIFLPPDWVHYIIQLHVECHGHRYSCWDKCQTADSLSRTVEHRQVDDDKLPAGSQRWRPGSLYRYLVFMRIMITLETQDIYYCLSCLVTVWSWLNCRMCQQMCTMITDVVMLEMFEFLGAEPTTSDFTVVMHGSRYKTVEGLVLATDLRHQFSDLAKYGQVSSIKFAVQKL